MQTSLVVALLVSSLAIGCQAGGAVSLTKASFGELVANSGKSAFVKFFAPWCGHCKAMAPAWNSLGDEYAASSVVIGDVDCTVETELCSDHGVSGYPTVKYFTAATGPEGEKYSGGRDLDTLKSFTADSLAAKCDVEDPSAGCSEKEIKFLDVVKAKGADFIAKQKTRLEGMLSKPMTAELKGWVVQRFNILKQLVTPDKEEL